MASSSKRQTTMAKMQREQRVREKRVLKAEKKQAAATAKLAGTAEAPVEETLSEDGSVASEDGSLAPDAPDVA